MKRVLAVLSLLLVISAGRSAGAVKVFEDKDKGVSLNVGVLIQPTFQLTTPASTSGGPGPCNPAGTRNNCSAGIGNARGDGPGYELYVRRSLVLLWGNITKDLWFFMDPAEANIGKGGAFNTSLFVQDAFFAYTFHRAFTVDAGLMLPPFSHSNLEGSASLHALDFHVDLLRFPTGRVFRDAGVEFRGLALGDHLAYRVGAFEGVRNTALPAVPMGQTRTVLNPGSVPRVTGLLRGNILGSEPDFFYKGIYFSETPILSVGVGGDWQSKSVIRLDGTHGDYFAMNADVFLEYPFSALDELIFKGNYYYYAEGQSAVAGTTMVPAGAQGFYAEAGFRHNWLEPIAYVEMLNGAKDSLKLLALHGGVNVWFSKHSFNLKTDVGYRRTERKAASTLKDIFWTTQAQVFF